MKAKIRPSKESSIFGIIMSIFFGIVMTIGLSIGEFPILAIIGVWIFISFGVAYQLMFLGGKPASTEEVELDKNVDFEDKLKKLENLKRDKLISESEYKQKRSEIMNQKW
jgi:hypothetical protein